MAKAADVPLTAEMPFAEAARATVRVRAGELEGHLERVLDMEDIEQVHAARVATRRLRAVLEVYAPCFPKAELRPVLRDVKALADALGARRDPDVQLDALGRFAAAVPEADWAGIDVFADQVRREQLEGNAVLEGALAVVRESDLHGRLQRLAADPADPEAGA
jgi:CHAD domain-containing protein